MRLRQLECYVRVCDIGSITRAAEQLNIAQPALGLQIRNLEHEFGVQLLVRNSRGVQPTEAGRILLDKARATLGEMRALRTQFRELGGGRQSLSLGLSPSMTSLIAGDLLAAARAEIPRLALHLVEDLSHVLAEWVMSDELDIALAYNVPERESLERLPLLREELVLVQSAADAPETDGPVTLAEALDGPLAIPGPKDSVRRAVEQAARRQDIPLIALYEIQSVTAIRDLVRRGAARSILPLGTVHREMQAGELIVRPIVDPPISRTLFLIRIRGREEIGPERELVGLLRRITATLPRAGAYRAYFADVDAAAPELASVTG
jgi:LysR family nitrogen assimilation transcriptional regulator